MIKPTAPVPELEVATDRLEARFNRLQRTLTQQQSAPQESRP